MFNGELETTYGSCLQDRVKIFGWDEADHATYAGTGRWMLTEETQSGKAGSAASRDCKGCHIVPDVSKP